MKDPLDPSLRAPDGMAMCARCGSEFVFWYPQPWPPREMDVFHKIQQAIGKLVCPECIASLPPPPPPEDIGS